MSVGLYNVPSKNQSDRVHCRQVDVESQIGEEGNGVS